MPVFILLEYLYKFLKKKESLLWIWTWYRVIMASVFYWKWKRLCRQVRLYFKAWRLSVRSNLCTVAFHLRACVWTDRSIYWENCSMTVTCVRLSYRCLYITLSCQTVTHTLTSPAWGSRNLHRPHRKITELLERYRKDTHKLSVSDITYSRYQGLPNF